MIHSTIKLMSQLTEKLKKLLIIKKQLKSDILIWPLLKREKEKSVFTIKQGNMSLATAI